MSQSGTYSPFRPIEAIRLLLELGKKHYRAIGAIAVFLHFVAWRIVRDLKDFLPDYLEEMFATQISIPSNADIERMLVSLLYFLLLHVGITTLIVDLLRRRRAFNDPEGTIKHGIEGTRALEFFFDTLRSLGVLILTTVAAAIAVVTGMALVGWLVEIFGITWDATPAWLRPIFAIPSFLMAAFLVTRLALAIPLTTIENSGVFASLVKSWKMTSLGTWIRLNLSCVPTYLLFSLWLLYIFRYFPFSLERPIEDVISWLLLTIITAYTATIEAVCYESVSRSNQSPSMGATDE